MNIDLDLYDKNIRGRAIPYVCDTCGQFGLKDRKYISLAMKRNQKNIFCSEHCRTNRNITSICKCTYCKKDFNKRNKEIQHGRNNFCSHSCRAYHHNIIRNIQGFSVKNITKNISCVICRTTHSVQLNRKNYFICDQCKTNHPKNKKEKSIECVHCKNIFISYTRKTCSDKCYNLLRMRGGQKGGRKSAAIQSISRRSKNEKLFAEKCKEIDSALLTNIPLFNGWDADVILPTYKVAVLWNGAWHYTKITKQHSVEQVQNRDKIKTDEIIKTGFIPYVIKDMGKYNPTFVQEQFDIFNKWLNEKFPTN